MACADVIPIHGMCCCLLSALILSCPAHAGLSGCVVATRTRMSSWGNAIRTIPARAATPLHSPTPVAMTIPAPISVPTLWPQPALVLPWNGWACWKLCAGPPYPAPGGPGLGLGPGTQVSLAVGLCIGRWVGLGPRLGLTSGPKLGRTVGVTLICRGNPYQ